MQCVKLSWPLMRTAWVTWRINTFQFFSRRSFEAYHSDPSSWIWTEGPLGRSWRSPCRQTDRLVLFFSNVDSHGGTIGMVQIRTDDFKFYYRYCNSLIRLAFCTRMGHLLWRTFMMLECMHVGDCSGRSHSSHDWCCSTKLLKCYTVDTSITHTLHNP